MARRRCISVSSCASRLRNFANLNPYRSHLRPTDFCARPKSPAFCTSKLFFDSNAARSLVAAEPESIIRCRQRDSDCLRPASQCNYVCSCAGHCAGDNWLNDTGANNGHCGGSTCSTTNAGTHITPNGFIKLRVFHLTKSMHLQPVPNDNDGH